MKKIIKENESAVSAVIGVILMVAITVAIAATVYVYVSGMMGGGLDNTPVVSMIAEPSEDKNEVIITIITITDGGVNWNDVSGSLVNISSSTSELNGTAWRLENDEVSGGDIITLVRYNDIDGDFTIGDEYRFTLIYDVTGGTLGTVTWTHL